MKRVYVAAGLMVVAGAVAGYMLAPRSQAPVAVEAETVEAAPAAPVDKPRSASSGGGGGGGMSFSMPVSRGLPGLVGRKSGGTEARPDCYFLRISYNNAMKAGARSPKAAKARNQAKQAGCFVPEPKT